MPLLIAFQNLLFKKNYFVSKRNEVLSPPLGFDYQQKYIDVLCHGGFAWKNIHEDET